MKTPLTREQRTARAAGAIFGFCAATLVYFVILQSISVGIDYTVLFSNSPGEMPPQRPGDRQENYDWPCEFRYHIDRDHHPYTFAKTESRYSQLNHDRLILRIISVLVFALILAFVFRAVQIITRLFFTLDTEDIDSD